MQRGSAGEDNVAELARQGHEVTQATISRDAIVVHAPSKTDQDGGGHGDTDIDRLEATGQVLAVTAKQIAEDPADPHHHIAEAEGGLDLRAASG